MLESALERKHGDGPYLFGPIGAVDAFYAPVAVRLTAYGVTGTNTPRADVYLHDLLAHASVRRWLDAARAMHGTLPADAPNSLIEGVSIDTRTLRPGDLFFALHGARHDGHDFVADALRAGAAAVVVERELGNTQAGPPA